MKITIDLQGNIPGMYEIWIEDEAGHCVEYREPATPESVGAALADFIRDAKEH